MIFPQWACKGLSCHQSFLLNHPEIESKKQQVDGGRRGGREGGRNNFSIFPCSWKAGSTRQKNLSTFIFSLNRLLQITEGVLLIITSCYPQVAPQTKVDRILESAPFVKCPVSYLKYTHHTIKCTLFFISGQPKDWYNQ